MDKKNILSASEVCEFLEELSRTQRERWDSIHPQCIPFGDLAYGSALVDWNKKGRPTKAWFSYAPGETACPYLMEFRKEISEKFGLPILTTEEGEKKRKEGPVRTKKVYDWGLN